MHSAHSINWEQVNVNLPPARFFNSAEHAASLDIHLSNAGEISNGDGPKKTVTDPMVEMMPLWNHRFAGHTARHPCSEFFFPITKFISKHKLFVL